MTNTTPAVAASIESLRAAVSGAVALPGEPGYELATPWNVAVPVRPHAVVAVESADDVAAAVRYAADHGLKVAVQRTGHGAVPLGDDVLLVHTGRLTECAIDPDARTARLGAGVVWQDVIDAATPHGLAPLAGSSTTVGVAGFLTGGGIGRLSCAALSAATASRLADRSGSASRTGNAASCASESVIASTGLARMSK